MAKHVLIDADKLRTGYQRDLCVLERTILDGGCADYADYRYKVGWRRGLIKINDLLQTLVNNKESDEDDD